MHISKKTIYVHFAGKRELYGYIVERAGDAAEGSAQVERGRAAGQPGEGRDADDGS